MYYGQHLALPRNHNEKAVLCKKWKRIWGRINCWQHVFSIKYIWLEINTLNGLKGDVLSLYCTGCVMTVPFIRYLWKNAQVGGNIAVWVIGICSVQYCIFYWVLSWFYYLLYLCPKMAVLTIFGILLTRYICRMYKDLQKVC